MGARDWDGVVATDGWMDVGMVGMRIKESLGGSEGCLSEYAGDRVVGMVLEARGVSIAAFERGAWNDTYTSKGLGGYGCP
jgi:hypothetical protein